MTKTTGEQPMYAEIAIVGAGPIGLELAVALKRIGADYIHFDAHQIGHTISWWPRDTQFFSTSERVAIAGIPIQSTHHGRITGEEYLAYLRAIVERYDLQVRTYEPVVEITRLEMDEASGASRYLVRDNGPGIPEEHLDDVFIPFFKGKSGDSGIGLAIVDKVVKVYRGEVRAYNDNGACFEFTLRDFEPGASSLGD